VKPLSTLLRCGGNPRTIWSGQQRRVDDASLLEDVGWIWALQSAMCFEHDGKSQRAQRLRVFITSSIHRCLHFFFIGHVFVVA
jgi:hypothetical protein